MRSAIKLRRLLQTSELLYAPLLLQDAVLPYEAFHSVRGCLQRTAAPKGQMICNDCCRHLLGLPLYLLTTVTNAGCGTVTIQGAFNVGLWARQPPGLKVPCLWDCCLRLLWPHFTTFFRFFHGKKAANSHDAYIFAINCMSICAVPKYSSRFEQPCFANENGIFPTKMKKDAPLSGGISLLESAVFLFFQLFDD